MCSTLEGLNLVWSPDSQRLYFALPEGKGHLGQAYGWKLFAWGVGDREAEPVEGVALRLPPKFAVSPKTGDLLIGDWQGLEIVDQQGRVKHLERAKSSREMQRSVLLGLNTEGRAVIQNREKPSLSTLDLVTGEVKRIYP